MKANVCQPCKDAGKMPHSWSSLSKKNNHKRNCPSKLKKLHVALESSALEVRVILVDLVQGQYCTKYCKITVISLVFRFNVVIEHLHSVY